MQGGYDESLFGRDLNFCRPVDFRVRKVHRKSASHQKCVAGTMSLCSAEILFFAGRSVFRAEKVHRKSASRHLGEGSVLLLQVR